MEGKQIICNQNSEFTTIPIEIVIVTNSIMIQLISFSINDPTNCLFNQLLLPMTFHGLKTPTGDQTQERRKRRQEREERV